MHSQRILRSALSLFASLGISVSLSAKEMLKNKDFSNHTDGILEHWEYRKNENETAKFSLVKTEGEPAYVTISSSNPEKSSALGQAGRNFKLPAGSTVTISGEYRTKNIEFGPGTQHLFTALLMRHRYGNTTQPQVWLVAEYDTPSDTWKAFTETRRLPVDVEYFGLYPSLFKSAGTVFYRNLSINAEEPTTTPDPNAEYIWREAEDIARSMPVSDWGHEIPGYYSGRGGVGANAGKGKFEWTVDIAPITDEIKLNSIPRTWHVWGRIYGYIENPRIFFFHNDKRVSYVDTPANEKVNAAGEYAGPGKYVWAYFGSFTTKGGAQKLTFKSEKRMCFDAFLLTTDSKYAPQMYEAKDMPQAKSHDAYLNHMMRAEYSNEGVTEEVPLPISFRGVGDLLDIPNDQPPALFHASLPEYIKVKAVSSHFRGENWDYPRYWGKKFMTCNQTGTRMIDGVKFIDYCLPLYAVTTNQYLLYVQADKGSLKPGATSKCEYWLEHNGEKQTPDQIVLNHVRLTKAKPFKKIFIGPASVHYPMIYRSMPDLFTNMKALGLNYLGGWHDYPWSDPSYPKLRDEAFANGFRISVCVPIYSGIRQEDVAIGMDGKPIKELSGGETKITSLVFDENTPYIKQSMDIIRTVAALGVSVEFDDEMNNVLDDKIDYSSQTAEFFKKWLTEQGKGNQYRLPLDIVKNKKTNPALYDLWVEFKCQRTAYRYSLFRKAFDEGVAQAKGKYPEEFKPLMITCIEGSTRQFKGIKDIRERCYYDFRMLNKYCDVIGVMTYSYGGMAQAGVPADTLEQHNTYVGEYCTGPVLLSGGYSCEPANKLRLKYEILDSLMEKPKVISFYAGATLFNPPTMAPVTEAIRIAQPYEDFFVDGVKYTNLHSDAKWLKLRALKLGKKLIVYAANYKGDEKATTRIDIGESVKKITAIADNSPVAVSKDGFTFDTARERGQMFLVELN